MSKRAKRMLELRIIDAMRAWPAGEPVTVRAIAKAVGVSHLTLPETIQSMRCRGVIELNRLALTPVFLAANDPDPAETEAAMDFSPNASAPLLLANGQPDVRAEKLLAILTNAARAGEPCPKNWTMGKAIGAADVQVHHALVRLKLLGRIEVESGTHPKQRRIRIIADDIWTDWTSPDEARRAEGVLLVPDGDERESIIARVEEKEQARATRVAALIRQEAEAAGARRRLARSTGTVSRTLPAPVAADPDLSLGAQIQMHAIKDSAGSVPSVLRTAWPIYWALLGRLAQACGERPIPLILRLIREEAERRGLRRSRPHDPAWFVPNGGGLDSDFDGEDFGEQGISIHG